MKSVSILGMERSGTSLTAKILHMTGYRVENDWRPSDRFNPEGYWESRRLAQINDEILGLMGGNRYQLPDLQNDWEKDSKLNPVIPKAADLLKHMEAYPRWAWKDPVLSVTMPFWRPLVPKGHGCIICVRNPLSISMSRKHMTNSSTQESSHLWWTYYTRAISGSRGLPRTLVHYEGYFDDLTFQTQVLNQFLGFDTGSAVRDTIAKDLNHYGPTRTETLISPDISSSVKILYTLLLEIQGTSTEDILGLAERYAHSDKARNEVDLARLQAEVEFYRRIVNHPYVRFGRFMSGQGTRLKKIMSKTHA